ncbi:MAG: hypothetical protein IPM96_20215 [Ignavibacteria bacterium]|nr:hypothetical protein [Ignavibacteria bacterium]
MIESDLNTIIGIAEILFFLTMTVLAVYLIISLKKFSSSISTIENKVIEMTEQITPVISDMKIVTDDIREIADRAKFQYNKIEDVSDSVITKGHAVVNTLESLHSYSRNLLENSRNFISALSNGFRSFKNKLSASSFHEDQKVIFHK